MAMTNPEPAALPGGAPPPEAPAPPKLPDALVVALVLLPGFVTERVSEYYSTGPTLSDAQTVAAALAATLINVGLASVLWWIGLRRVDRHKRISPFHSPPFLVLLFITSVLSGASWAMIDSRDLVYRYIDLTGRASRAEVWDKVFRENRAWQNFVKVTLTDGRVYHGLPRFFSEGGEDKSVFLKYARFERSVAARGSSHHKMASKQKAPSTPVECIDVPGEGVLIPIASIRVIEFRALSITDPYPCPGAR